MICTNFYSINNVNITNIFNLNLFKRIKPLFMVGFAATSLVSVVSIATFASPKAADFNYQEGSNQLVGYLAEPSQPGKKFPGLIIVHDWMGLSEDNKQEAREWASQGYVALAADIYGKGQRPKDSKEAGQFAGKYKGDRKLLRARINSAYEALKKNPLVDTNKIVVYGYCFGGTTALELARSGAPLAGAVSFHGGLDNPAPSDAKNIQGKVLVLHGAIDPFVPAKDVDAFEKEMTDAGKDYQLIKYSGAVHAFTNKKAGSDVKTGAAYNELADKRSKAHFKQFLSEIF